MKPLEALSNPRITNSKALEIRDGIECGPRPSDIRCRGTGLYPIIERRIWPCFQVKSGVIKVGSRNGAAKTSEV